MLLTLEDIHPLYLRKRRMARASGQKVGREHHRPRSFYFTARARVKLSADSKSPFEAKNLYVNLSLNAAPKRASILLALVHQND